MFTERISPKTPDQIEDLALKLLRRRLSRRDFLKIALFLPNLLSACINNRSSSFNDASKTLEEPLKTICPRETAPTDPESAIYFLDGALKNGVSAITFISTDPENKNWHSLTREEGRRLVKEPESLRRALEQSPLLASAIALAPPLAATDGPFPAGDAVALIIALAAGGAAAFEYYQHQQTREIKVLELTPNRHAIEQRGEKLAYYIAHIINTSFLGGNMPPDWKKRVICFAGEVIEGLRNLGFWIVEVPSRSVQGARRIAIALAGEDIITREAKLVTLIYADSTADEYIEKQLERHGGFQSAHGQEECNKPDFMGPGFIERVP